MSEQVAFEGTEWRWREVGPGPEFSAVGDTVSMHSSFTEACGSAQMCGWSVVVEDVEKAKFIVRGVRDPTQVVLKITPGGPWKVYAIWRPSDGWIVVPANNEEAAIGQSEGGFTGFEDACAHAKSVGCVAINEDLTTKRFVVRRVDQHKDLRLGSFKGGPWRVHMAPLDVVIGLGVSKVHLQAQRVEKCVEVLGAEGGTLLWTCSQNEFNQNNFFSHFGMHCEKMTARGLKLDAWRIIVDTRARSSLGNSRFAIERILTELVVPGICVRIHLVTNDFHIGRARMIFD